MRTHEFLGGQKMCPLPKAETKKERR